ncbi:hypothetical protein [Candidatus Desulforudis audaxviator]|uniref:SipL SPOCS domain-containing protein n=1 Tax=Desulforudis audaxviator (strain MP104C) TaxID=477974 RepID=B1I148_DESAP|nr:hypothetical protein [Candidatus Desulforudis audaxviator]ACA58585.1 hypothetical protein Daud_0016 [Candidatus Desulforudis audaxviator MP104C]AZK58579.1 hypothetical protein Daudx_0019 [Candidatus Desulforudis audaxviator]
MSPYKRQNNGVQPGPCPLVDGVPQCPPPTQIDIIKVTKVFEECMHTQVEEVEIIVAIAPSPELVAQCVGVTVLTSNCQVLNGNIVKFEAQLEVTTSVNGETGTGTIEIEKFFFMERAAEQGLSPQCHIYPECLICFISATDVETVTVTCCVGVLILLKLEADVQLMIPSYGYPPEPEECEEAVGQCPPQYDPVWPPYPAQSSSSSSNNNPRSLLFGHKGCKGKK